MKLAALAQSVERKAFNLVVVGSSPTRGDILFVAALFFVKFHSASNGSGVHFLRLGAPQTLRLR